METPPERGVNTPNHAPQQITVDSRWATDRSETVGELDFGASSTISSLSVSHSSVAGEQSTARSSIFATEGTDEQEEQPKQNDEDSVKEDYPDDNSAIQWSFANLSNSMA